MHFLERGDHHRTDAFVGLRVIWGRTEKRQKMALSSERENEAFYKHPCIQHRNLARNTPMECVQSVQTLIIYPLIPCDLTKERGSDSCPFPRHSPRLDTIDEGSMRSLR
ncbi:hypothetical protein CEXT_183551 [Caerostris extrusa]|uniref:Uncharacterized protein n=1 Tax=Caerostris extrusa TaxID=172846 RepID=A0AAV4UN48_CAEEX|nr:hypothetical protein CEXT_183551 [Caerostris extrusa]